MSKIILDCCNNHLGNTEIIEAMIRRAIEMEVNVIKFQLFNPQKLNKNYPGYDFHKAVYKKCELTEDMVRRIIYLCGCRIKPCFTIFSTDRVPFLINAINKTSRKPGGIIIKIASPDMSNYELIDTCVEAFLPDSELIISTGMGTQYEIQKVRSRYPFAKFLYCISQYPTPEKFVDLEEMLKYDGFSDHTKSIEKAMRAVDIGIEYIEMHYTLSKNLPCKDNIVSKTPEEIEDFMGYKNSRDDIIKYKSRWKNEEAK